MQIEYQKSKLNLTFSLHFFISVSFLWLSAFDDHFMGTFLMDSIDKPLADGYFSAGAYKSDWILFIGMLHNAQNLLIRFQMS